MTYKVRHSAAASCLANCATRDKGASAVSKTSTWWLFFPYDRLVQYISTLCPILSPLSLTSALHTFLSLFSSLSLTLYLMDVQTRLPQHSSACEMLYPRDRYVLVSGIFDCLRGAEGDFIYCLDLRAIDCGIQPISKRWL